MQACIPIGICECSLLPGGSYALESSATPKVLAQLNNTFQPKLCHRHHKNSSHPRHINLQRIIKYIMWLRCHWLPFPSHHSLLRTLPSTEMMSPTVIHHASRLIHNRSRVGIHQRSFCDGHPISRHLDVQRRQAPPSRVCRIGRRGRRKGLVAHIWVYYMLGSCDNYWLPLPLIAWSATTRARLP